MLYRLDDDRSILASGYSLTAIYKGTSLGNLPVAPYNDPGLNDNPAKQFITECLNCDGMDYELIWTCIMDHFEEQPELI
ncbi:MAG: hypothetical protein R3321_09555 [Nitrososphaeraceae archaeon]|nr:hypothetical protein [Nitrososphaeraceae archaeon]